MQNKVIAFFKKYWLCILLSVIMVGGITLSTHYADLYKTGSAGDMIRFNLRELYLIYLMPIYCFIYGCLSYIKVKKIWLPQLILCVVSFLYWLILDKYALALAWVGIFIWLIYPVLFSLIGSSITAYVCCLIRSIKEDENQNL